MNEVFADTSGWANFFVQSEPFHVLAFALSRQWQTKGIRVVTTNYVLAELTSVLTSPLRIARASQMQFVATIHAAPWVDIVHIDPVLDAAAWNLWRSRPDKTWSLTDCASFTVMQRRGITEALTTDHHFEQAGYVRLLK